MKVAIMVSGGLFERVFLTETDEPVYRVAVVDVNPADYDDILSVEEVIVGPWGYLTPDQQKAIQAEFDQQDISREAAQLYDETGDERLRTVM